MDWVWHGESAGLLRNELKRSVDACRSTSLVTKEPWNQIFLLNYHHHHQASLNISHPITALQGLKTTGLLETHVYFEDPAPASAAATEPPCKRPRVIKTVDFGDSLLTEFGSGESSATRVPRY